MQGAQNIENIYQMIRFQICFIWETNTHEKQINKIK